MMTYTDDYYFGAKSSIDDVVGYAAARARREPGRCLVVYRSEYASFVRPSEDPAPEGATVYGIAQQWHDDTVQLRYPGDRSEWITVDKSGPHNRRTLEEGK